MHICCTIGIFRIVLYNYLLYYSDKCRGIKRDITTDKFLTKVHIFYIYTIHTVRIVYYYTLCIVLTKNKYLFFSRGRVAQFWALMPKISA